MHYAIIDLGYGDAGKGILTARLCAEEEIAWTIRFSGGCQAAHNVITNEDDHHTFAQFGSGTFNNSKTYLSKYMLVEPFSLINESKHLAKLGVHRPLTMVVIDPEALLTTPYHWELNRFIEDTRGEARHGSCGRGIGMTTLYSLMHDNDEVPKVGDIYTPTRLLQKLTRLRKWCISKACPEDRLPSPEDLLKRYQEAEPFLQIMKMSWNRILTQDQVVFEGSQGVLLDQDHGFHPYTTWTCTTDINVRNFLRDASRSEVPLTTIGITRSYMTRHGAGPFVTEMPDWPIREAHNKTGQYQGGWRQGYQDLVALRYAIECCVEIDSLYVTHIDAPPIMTCRVANSYRDEQGEPFKLEHLPTEDSAGRQRQSEALSRLHPTYVPQDWVQPAESLSKALDLPLFGKGWGPRIGDGKFL